MSDKPKVTGRPRWSIFRTTTVESRLKIVILWYHDGQTDSVKDDRATVLECFKAIEDYCGGKTKRLDKLPQSTLFELSDALLSFPRRDRDVRLAGEEFDRRFDAACAASEGERK